jgi:hypothetical protein
MRKKVPLSQISSACTYRNPRVIHKAYQIFAFAVDKSAAKAAAAQGRPSPQGRPSFERQVFLVFRNVHVLDKAYQVGAFAVGHSVAQAVPQERRPLVFRKLCAVGKAYQITAFAVDNTVIACSVYRRLTQLVRLVIDGCEPL